MNRTLLVEEGDDEGTDNRLDKKKKDKEKLQEIAGGYKCLSNIKAIKAMIDSKNAKRKLFMKFWKVICTVN